MTAEQRRSRRRARAGYWRIYRRRRGLGSCGCPAYHFPHRFGSCATGHDRALRAQVEHSQAVAG